MIRVVRRLFLAGLVFAPAMLAEPATPAPARVGGEEPVRFTSRPLTFNVMLGVGTPVGGVGGVVEYNLGSRFAVGAGVGAGWFGFDGVPGPVQVAALVRFRLAVLEEPRIAQAFDSTLAFATGRFTYPLFSGDRSSVSERAYWVQLALEYELITRGGFRFATGPGIALLAAASDVQDDFSDFAPLSRSDVPSWFASFDLTFGFGI